MSRKILITMLLVLLVPATALAGDGGGISAGDTAWILVSTAVVMLMTPGLALFYGGMVRGKNILGTLMQSFFILCLISIQWVVWGYSLSFGSDISGFIGGLGHLGLSGVGIEAKGGSWSAEEEEAFKAPLREQYETEGHPYYASARLWDDGIIDPVDTRKIIAMGIAMSMNNKFPEQKYGVFRM